MGCRASPPEHDVINSARKQNSDFSRRRLPAPPKARAHVKDHLLFKGRPLCLPITLLSKLARNPKIKT
jgi:hypothetical protein